MHQVGVVLVVLHVIFCTAAAQPIDMVPLPAGVITLGGTGGDSDEMPSAIVRISPFTIDRTEVTFEQYESCVRRGACTPAHYTDGKCLAWIPPSFRSVLVPADKRSPRFPVVCVTWEQARAYCSAAGKRLPTEPQWEYAARAGTENRYSWGDAAPTPKRCAAMGRRCPDPVGAHAPDARGIHDMTGNVWEWTSDWYQQNRYGELQQSAVVTDPAGPVVGRYRVIRGGGWYSDPAQLRIKNRHWFSPEFAEVSIGFRCVGK